MSKLELEKLKAGFDATLAAKKGGEMTEALPADSPRASTPDVDSPEMRRERRIAEKEEEIKGIRESTNMSIKKEIPGLGVDLRPAAVDKWLADNQTTPWTEKAEDRMKLFDRYWARKWLEYKEGKGPPVAEPVSEPRPVEPPLAAPGKETVLGAKLEGDEEYVRDMTNEQVQSYSELMKKIKIRSLGLELNERYKTAKPEEAGEVENSRGRFDALRNACRDMVRDKNFNLKYFRENFLNPEIITEDYWEEFEKRKAGGKIKDNRELGKFKREFLNEIKKYAIQAEYDDEGVKQIVRYFNSRISLEHFIKNKGKS